MYLNEVERIAKKALGRMPEWSEGRDINGKRSSLRSWPSLDLPVEAQLCVENYIEGPGSNHVKMTLRNTLPYLLNNPTRPAIEDYITRLFQFRSPAVKTVVLVEGLESAFAQAVVGMTNDVMVCVKAYIQDRTKITNYRLWNENAVRWMSWEDMDLDEYENTAPACYPHLPEAQEAKELYIWTSGYLEIEERLVIVGFNKYGQGIRDEHGQANISEGLGNFGN